MASYEYRIYIIYYFRGFVFIFFIPSLEINNIYYEVYLRN